MGVTKLNHSSQTVIAEDIWGILLDLKEGRFSLTYRVKEVYLLLFVVDEILVKCLHFLVKCFENQGGKLHFVEWHYPIVFTDPN